MIDLGDFNPYLQGVYTDLDSIFDTRFAVLEQVDQHLALRNLKKGWNTRTADLFEGIDKKLFDELYQSRDNSVLAIAPKSILLQAIKTWVLKALAAIQGSPNGDKVEVFVNVWPYNITREKAKEIGNTIVDILGNQVTVHMVNIAIEKLDTKTVKRYFSAMFMYDYDVWLESCTKQGFFDQMKVPDVSLYAPKLYKTDIPSEEQLREMKTQKVDIFGSFEIVSGQLIGVEFIDPAFFSCMLPQDYLDNIEEVKKAVQSADVSSPIIT